MAKPKDYEVGKGKPPKHTRFKPGESGRTRGRKALAPVDRTPRVDISLLEALRTVARRKTRVREGDRVRVLTYAEVIAERIIRIGAQSTKLREVLAVANLLARIQAFGDRPMTDQENMDDFLKHMTPEDHRAIHEILGMLAKYKDSPAGKPPTSGGTDGSDDQPDPDEVPF